MIREELKQLKTGPRDLRKFGLMVGGVFVLLGGWFLFRHKPWYLYLLIPGALLVLAGLLAPKSLRQVYLGWMAMAFVLGHIMSTLLLVVLFYLVVTPIGLLARGFGKDFLHRKWDRQAATYWLPRDLNLRPRSDYERQF